VSESDAIRFVKFSPRDFARALGFGIVLCAAAMTVQHGTFKHAVSDVSVQRPVLPRLVPVPAARIPSAFDIESDMTPAQLLNRWDADIAEASKRFHVPKTWIRAVMARESGGRTMLTEGAPMVSNAGAIGLMQVLPETYAEMRAQYNLGADPFNTHDNILAGAAYLRWLHGKYGYPAMFAAYNAGPGRLEDHMNKGTVLPAETRAYIGAVTRALNPRGGATEFETVKLTQPDGAALKLDVGKITALRAALPGEYAASVKSVVILGKRAQGIQEDVAVARAAIRATGGSI
jgi:membrane-bound lytic murein transglycosylase B